MRFLKFFASRLFITILIIAVQVAWLVVMFLKLTEYSEWISIVLQVLSLVMVLYIIGKDEIPAYRIGWIVMITFIPVFGGLLYLLLGEKRPAAHMRRKLAVGTKDHNQLIIQDPEIINALRLDSLRVAGCSNYINRYAQFPAYRDTSVKYHCVGEAHYADLIAELEKAEHFIFMEYFIIEGGFMWDSILEILTRKAAAGVDVRLSYDDLGSLSKIPIDFSLKLEKLGIKCLVFNPFVPFISLVMNNRNHRKMAVIDGKTAFTGGINLADEYINRKVRFGHWKDSGIMLRGEAVWSFTVMFLEMWNSFHPTDTDFTRFKANPEDNRQPDDGFVQPFGDSPLDGETVSVNVYLDILAQAKEYCYIFTPYLAISDELQISLCAASKRGVDVRIVLPGIPDKKIAYRLSRSYYLPLLKAGVKIYEYTPGFIHSKSYVCDDELAVVGTINMDYRSLYLHFECGVFMYKTSAISDLKADALETFAISHMVTIGERHRGPIRGIIGGLIDSILRVFSPLF